MSNQRRPGQVAPRTCPLDRAAEALSDLGGRRVTGKLALVP